MAWCTPLVLAFVALSVDVTKGAYNTKATFPNINTFPRLRLTDTLPPLKEFTICVWTRQDVINGVATSILSYATDTNDNELYLFSHRVIDDVKVQLQVGKKYTDFNCTGLYQNLGSWQHLCATWFGPDGSANVYVNGEPCGIGSKLPANITTVGGGVVILGQDQDSMDGGFQASQALIGDMAELHMWDEVLSVDAIWEAGRCNPLWTNGNIINWLKTPMVVYGNVTFSETQLCKS